MDLTDTQKEDLIDLFNSAIEREIEEEERMEKYESAVENATSDKARRRNARKAADADNRASFHLGEQSGIAAALEALGWNLICGDDERAVDVQPAPEFII